MRWINVASRGTTRTAGRGVMPGVACLFLSVLPTAALTMAPIAHADCVTSNGATLCSDGEARGPSNSRGPSVRGPYVPYPCNSLYCGGGLAIALRD